MGIAIQFIEGANKDNFPITLSASFTKEQFSAFCKLNDELRIERLANGNIYIMPPTHASTGAKNANIFGELFIWNKKHRLGRLFDSSTGFALPNGAIRSPDLSWIENSRWEALSQEEKNDFSPICPDFVIELMSTSDKLADLRLKMEEYMSNGCRLGWLIDPGKQQTLAYHADGSVERIPFDALLEGREVLRGCSLCLADILSD